MASTLGKPNTHQRQSSRPGSASTSSVVTVQRAVSMTSRNGSRPRNPLMRSPSPDDIAGLSSGLTARTISPDPNRRSSAIYPRPESSNGVKEGMGNLNRWSQSTASNRSSLNNRRNSVSKRLSSSFAAFGHPGNSQLSTSPSGAAYTGRSSSSNSPQKRLVPSQGPPPTLSPMLTLSSSSQTVDDTDTPSTINTRTPKTAALLSSTSYNSASDQDYFGKEWKPRSPLENRTVGPKSVAGVASSSASFSQRTGVASNYNTRISRSAEPDPAPSYAPNNAAQGDQRERRQSRKRHSRNREENSKSSAGTEGESSASSSRISRRRDSKRASQKAMLSKALAKAKHAVLLDNAQNFEGAMVAYGDACALLQQVMNRSSGEDDRKKLEAVVSARYNPVTFLKSNFTSDIPTKLESMSFVALIFHIKARTEKLCPVDHPKETLKKRNPYHHLQMKKTSKSSSAQL